MRPSRRLHRASASAGARPLGQKAPEPEDIVKETRAEATARVTCQAAAWLWHTRGCRAIAKELGIDWDGHLDTAWGGHWRVDMAGAVEHLGRFVSYVIEVKGTYEDLAREHIAHVPPRLNFHSKWHRKDFLCHELWVACGDIKTGHMAVADVPEHWGVMVFMRDNGRVNVLRRSGKVDHANDSVHAQKTWRALAQVATAEDMPKFFNNRRRIQPWQALLNAGFAGESVTEKRDNSQMDIFASFDDASDQK